MSLYLNFEAHSWYKHFAINNNIGTLDHKDFGKRWYAVTDDGIKGYLVEYEADTLKELKNKISQYWSKKK